MAQLEVTVTGPGNRRKIWRLPDDQLIGLIASTLVERMGLPTQIEWTVVSTKKSKALAPDGTLAKEKIKPGDLLRLEPVRNTLFKQFLQALYDEAEGHVQDKLWDKAMEKMRQLHEYDPRFPDPKGVAALAQAGLGPSAIPASGVSWGLVVGGLALTGALVAGTAVIGAGAVGYAIWRANSEQNPTPAIERGGNTDAGQPHTGDVQITLQWHDTVDLDLHVYDPDGFHIYHGDRLAPSGGELDVDANYPCANVTTTPLENVYWPWDGAPAGEYEVAIRYFQDCTGEGPVSYEVAIRLDGNLWNTYSGQISPGEEVLIARFEY